MDSSCASHKIFITKVNIHAIFNAFTKFLDQKNLGLYGMLYLLAQTKLQCIGDFMLMRNCMQASWLKASRPARHGFYANVDVKGS